MSPPPAGGVSAGQHGHLGDDRPGGMGGGANVLHWIVLYLDVQSTLSQNPESLVSLLCESNIYNGQLPMDTTARCITAMISYWLGFTIFF